jgi:hypothetical protein
MLGGRLRYSDLKEAASRGSLWGLYTACALSKETVSSAESICHCHFCQRENSSLFVQYSRSANHTWAIKSLLRRLLHSCLV